MNNSIDQQFIEFVVKSLVNNPDAVSVARTIDEKGVLLELTVDPEDLGRVIGKRGATAQSLRTLLRALGTKNDARYNLKIIDNGEPMHRNNDDSTSFASSSSQSSSSDHDDAPSEAVQAAVEHPQEQDGAGDSDVLRKTRAELEDLDDLDV